MLRKILAGAATALLCTAVALSVAPAAQSTSRALAGSYGEDLGWG
ncbi:hypothetical protein ABZV67_14700 [Streptomyces sp. NPDC005065]